MLKKLFLFFILLSSCINLTLKSNEFDTFSDSYTNIFGETPAEIWTDKDSCKATCKACNGGGGLCGGSSY